MTQIVSQRGGLQSAIAWARQAREVVDAAHVVETRGERLPEEQLARDI
jgi:hypothetical protein